MSRKFPRIDTGTQAPYNVYGTQSARVSSVFTHNKETTKFYEENAINFVLNSSALGSNCSRSLQQLIELFKREISSFFPFFGDCFGLPVLSGSNEQLNTVRIQSGSRSGSEDSISILCYYGSTSRIFYCHIG
jgi:hypothetical protein